MEDIRLLLSHPTANANVRAAAKGFLEASILLEFHTCIASFQGSILDKLSSVNSLAEIRRRGFIEDLKPFTKTYPWKEVGRLIASRAGMSSLIQHEKGMLSIDAVYQSLDKRIATRLGKTALKNASAVYAYEDCAEYSFIKAKELNKKCFYDLPIGYWRAAKELLSNEIDRWPDWAPTFTGFSDSPSKLARKDNELQLADKIFVASQFTAKTLAFYPGKLAEIEIIPYGFPPVNHPKQYRSSVKKLKLLFVGGLSQRKGIADLFAAVDKLSAHVELTVVGRKTPNECVALDKELRKHNWIPSLSHAEILRLMHQHDVLVFPSLFEGFGLVITEAMAQGTPVITTDRTAGPDIITNEQNGWLIEAGSTDALIEAIEKLIQEPQKIAQAGKEALEAARKRPWEVYGQELAAAIKKSSLHQLNKKPIHLNGTTI